MAAADDRIKTCGDFRVTPTEIFIEPRTKRESRVKFSGCQDICKKIKRMTLVGSGRVRKRFERLPRVFFVF